MEFIYIKNKSLSPELCKDIITKFELSNNKYDGVTRGGLNKNIKDTLDLKISDNIISSDWNDVLSLLNKELLKNVKIYVNNINKNLCVNEEYSTTKFKYFEGLEISHETYLVQKYKKCSGRYVYHNDQHIDWNEKKYRILTYLWYLNDVDEGGETEFWGDYKIKPKAGQLLIFPSTWTFPHRGKVPVSSDKYIITGWIYSKND